MVADFSVRRPIHQDPEAAKENITRLSGMHGRPDTWVILAHEDEVVRAVPELEWLGDWQEKGWKRKVGTMRERADDDCFAAGKN